MWIYTNRAFLSIVQNNRNPQEFHVRARKAGDIEATFPGVEVTHTPHGDYKYRADIDRGDVMSAVFNAMQDIDYANFKNSVDDQDRHDAYLGVWQASFGLESLDDTSATSAWGLYESMWDDDDQETQGDGGWPPESSLRPVSDFVDDRYKD